MKNLLVKNLAKGEKEGAAGEILTEVFGVNDEVYQDIDGLQKNQQEIIQASNHQARFMVKMVSHINETEQKIATRLRNFTQKLNQGLEAVQEMQKWYKAANSNTISMNILHVQQRDVLRSA
ncbi:hypothetical protein WA026_018719 [Henosepilachna vigintioctopunctata]|uniref:Uncharacterized protein n=1 Tax=Henosepilachna vigintioctopunctata TaxID=420089 RepID=A0AAW1TW69_9CUCU